MFRGLVTIAIVLLVVGLVVVVTDVFFLGMDVSGAVALVHTQLRELASDFVTTAMENKGWAIVIIAGLVVVFFVARLSRIEKY